MLEKFGHIFTHLTEAPKSRYEENLRRELAGLTASLMAASETINVTAAEVERLIKENERLEMDERLLVDCYTVKKEYAKRLEIELEAAHELNRQLIAEADGGINSI